MISVRNYDEVNRSARLRYRRATSEAVRAAIAAEARARAARMAAGLAKASATRLATARIAEQKLIAEEVERRAARVAEVNALIAAGHIETPIPIAPNAKAAARRIIDETERKHGLEPGSIVVRCGMRSYVAARHEAAYRIRAETALSLPQIGELLKRNHATVIHAIGAHAVRAAKDAARG